MICAKCGKRIICARCAGARGGAIGGRAKVRKGNGTAAGKARWLYARGIIALAVMQAMLDAADKRAVKAAGMQ